LYQLNFENLVSYDAGKVGISVEVEIQFKDASVIFDAKIDTGATACIFERKYGEQLGLNIEKGSPKHLVRRLAHFWHTGIW
jgi:hypothetical protein